MKKTATSIMAGILCIVMFLSLAACGDSGSPAGDNTTSPSTGATAPSTTEPITTEPATEPVAELSLESLSLQSDLSQGAAWISYKESAGSDSAAGIVNTEGEIIPVAGITTGSASFSSFQGGYSYVNYRNNEKDIYCFSIFDSKGNITAQSPDDFAYFIVCGGDGYYLVRKFFKTMTANEEHYGIIDARGNWIYEPTQDFLPEERNYSMGACLYLGNGIFYCPGSGVYNDVLLDAKRTSAPIIEVSSVGPNFQALGLYDGSVILCETRNFEATAYRVDADGTCTVIGALGHMYGSMDNIAYGEGLIFIAGNVNYGESDNGCFMDTSGNVIADYTGYTLAYDGRLKDFGFKFIGGYAAVYIKGADGYIYLEIIDKTGTCAFEPTKLDSDNVERIYEGKVGCYINGKRVWVDTQGNITDHPDANFSNGYAVKNNQIINMDGEVLPLRWAQ